jgi:hypothetical protein
MSTRKNYTAPGKSAHPCNGVYLTHKWNGPIKLPVGEELLSRTCTRCGVSYDSIYAFRKEEMARKYRDAKR